MKTYLPAVIRMAERQRPQVERLLQYCYDLDGTKIEVISGPGPADSLSGPNRNDAAFHETAVKYAGKAFIWMEPDSIPRKAGWRAALTDEYRRVGAPILLPDMSGAQKHDIAAGIGIYPPETSWLIPPKFSQHAWDMWLTTNPINKIVGRTRLIQHSYGAYIGKRAEDHRFPRDNDVLWDESLLFHRDLHQDLITLAGYEPLSKSPIEPLPEGEVLRHGGDIGDVIAALPILRERGFGKIILFHDPNAPFGLKGRESLEGARYEALKPLLEAQHYVTGVEWGAGLDTTNFRTTMRPKNETLLERQAKHVGQWPLKDQSPWLYVSDVVPHKRVVVGRSPRYHNPHGFPWQAVANAYKDRLLFVGLPSEHKAFEEACGRTVEHAKTENLLDVARIIAGSPLTYVNQTAILWIALGLGARVVVEGDPEVPNSELYTNPQNFYAYTGAHIATIKAALNRI